MKRYDVCLNPYLASGLVTLNKQTQRHLKFVVYKLSTELLFESKCEIHGDDANLWVYVRQI
jgi:hypothetical protein